MSSVQLFFLDGFQNDEIHVSLSDQEPVVLSHVSSSLLTGLAKSTQLSGDVASMQVKIALPQRGITRAFTITRPFATVSLGPGGLELRQLSEPPGFA